MRERIGTRQSKTAINKAEAIQCNIQLACLRIVEVLRQPRIASPRFNGTYRKCGGGFAMTGIWTGVAPCGGTTPPLAGVPLH
ncbi:MAG: hypothetical protein LBM98_05570 [Oscillospiraceae bacterium]|nr:hypothetical protein [Oscillospiraceae bacterium]